MAADDLKLLIHTAHRPAQGDPAPAPRRLRIKTRLSFQERLLRNSCIACAVLLGVLALDNFNAPWAHKATQTIQQALTMEIDLDKSLGQLSFVQKLMPESALVFFNLSGGSELQPPVQGTPGHPYSDAQPWLMLECAPGSPACAAAEGVVSAVSQLSDGSWGILIDHGSGLESVTAGLSELHVQTGDRLLRGASIGLCGGELFFELRQDARPVDPTEKLGL